MAVSGGIGIYEQAHDHGQNLSMAICVEDHAELVKRIAQHMIAKMPASVQIEDLIQSGMIGLMEAAKKYDASRGASFETYAGIRIRGAIVDEIRKGDWVPRSVHRNARRIAETIAQLEASLGRDPKDHEVASTLGVELDEYYRMSRDATSGKLFSVDEPVNGEGTTVINFLDDDNDSLAKPDISVEQQSLRDALTKAIDRLPEKERMVLSLYYEQELNLKEIGLVLGVSESRVSQIHSQATLRLRSRLKDW